MFQKWGLEVRVAQFSSLDLSEAPALHVPYDFA